MKKSLSTVLHGYSFDTKTPEGAAAWAAFKAEREAPGARIMGPVYHKGSESSAFDGATIELETAHVFNNQWNATAPGGVEFRAFDWLLEAEGNGGWNDTAAPRGIKRGYWLELTPAMRALRDALCRCGYCGADYQAAEAPAFCDKCTGSPYLKEEDLHLTRVRPLMARGDRAKLSAGEAAQLVPLWREAQIAGEAARLEKKTADFIAKTEREYSSALSNAEREYQGKRWLVSNGFAGIACENLIYYRHTGRFSFGWHGDGLDYSLACELMGKLSDAGFPFPYDVKTKDRGTLNGCVAEGEG